MRKFIKLKSVVETESKNVAKEMENMTSTCFYQLFYRKIFISQWKVFENYFAFSEETLFLYVSSDLFPLLYYFSFSFRPSKCFKVFSWKTLQIFCFRLLQGNANIFFWLIIYACIMQNARVYKTLVLKNLWKLKFAYKDMNVKCFFKDFLHRISFDKLF